MRLNTLWLADFRSYGELEITFHEGFTAIVGPNGVGKTNVLEAIGLLATLKSFRGAPTESLVRTGAARAVVRASGVRDDRDVLIELEIAKGRTRAQVNRQKLQRANDLLGALRVTVFAPDDLAIVKGGPAIRRELLDDLLVALDPGAAAVLSDLDRILKQRNALLRRAGGVLDDDGVQTLDVWDTKLVSVGEHLTVRRENVLVDLMPFVTESYRALSGDELDVVAVYERSWRADSMADAVSSARTEDVRRAVTTIGPHRDDISFLLGPFDSRTQASQGEQRTLALALRLAGHHLVADRVGEPPLLLLDDVLSELDPDRAQGLLASLPPGQTIVTSATGLPPEAHPDAVLTDVDLRTAIDGIDPVEDCSGG